MARRPSTILTEAENRIMEVLWKKGEASVHDVIDATASEKTQAYTTVQTFLGIMKDKAQHLLKDSEIDGDEIAALEAAIETAIANKENSND